MLSRFDLKQKEFIDTMNMEMITDQFIFDWNDLFKAFLSLGAGFLLGFEREWKDKSAGFKTISIICLGSTLFSILSMKLGAGESEDATRIASYVVSGIGFLGAGVIFKDGVNVNGLTTASIIWMSAAVGMAIGFGMFITAIIFLGACFSIIISGPILNRYVLRNLVKVVTVKFDSHQLSGKEDFIEDIRPLTKQLKIKNQTLNKEGLVLVLEVLIDKGNIRSFENRIMAHHSISEVSL
ncbi:MgtC/SapB family protein [Sphingobacteruim zhuxiongii]|nr:MULTISPECIES: MgtC/SapB family protein [unclassified Sphingobacterium]